MAPSITAIGWIPLSDALRPAEHSTERRQGPVADDASYELLGFYMEDHIPLLNDRVEVTLGGRYTYAAADARDVEDAGGGPLSFTESWDTVVGSGRVLVRVDEPNHWDLFGGISQGFRAPNLSDLTRFRYRSQW